MDKDDDFKNAEKEEAKPLGKLEQEALTYEKAYCKLVIVMIVSSFFVVLQCIGGYLANSIAIFTDTAHLATDMLGFVMSMYALKVSLRPASKELTFGWHRAEIIGTLSSVMFLLTVTVWLLVEATKRIITPQPVLGLEMLITAIMAFFFNLVQMSILHQGDAAYHMGGEIGGGCSHGHDHGHDHEAADHVHAEGEEHDHDHEHEHKEEAPKERRNINLDAAFLHALGDMFLSLGVCVAATVIYFKPTWNLADPMCTIFFSIIVFFTVTPITKNCVSVLMEGAPKEVNIDNLIADIHSECHVKEGGVHDFHLWQISVGKYALSCHIDSEEPMKTLKLVTKLCKEKYNVDHVTIQIENSTGDNEHAFDCDQTTHHKMEL